MIRTSFGLVLLALGALLAACGSPIVGAECKRGFVLCDGVCVDLDNDPDHCGGCGDSCGAFTCEEAECTTERRPDPDMDAGGDGDGDAGSSDGGDLLDGGLGDGGRTPIGTGPFLPDGGLSFPDPDVDDGCALGQTECSGTCVDLQTSKAHCGECGNACAGDQLCALGMCVDICEEPLELCGDLCIDVASDPRNCGECGNVCASGICLEGACEDALPGDVVVIGHDYERTIEAQDTIVSNTVLLANNRSARAMSYRGEATSASVQGVERALSGGGVAVEMIQASADQVTAGLVESQLFVIHAQRNATDAELLALGEQWGLSLTQFVARGGVIALFDTPSPTNAGTFQILMPSGLFAAESRIALAASSNLRVQAPNDTVGNGVTATYRSSRNTVAFMEIASEGTVVVTSLAGDAVVVHRAIVP
jgi:hypothetical protein